MNESTITDDFLRNPGSIYEAPDKLSPEARRELFELEEALAATLLFEPLQGTQPGDEERIASLVDGLLNSTSGDESLSAEDRALVARAYLDARTMRDASTQAEAVPEVLKMVLERSLSAPEPARAKGEDAVPAIVLQIRDGLQVIKSAFQGLQLQNEAIVATRSAVAAPEARRSHVELRQQVDGRELEYQILSESDTAITLVVRVLNGGSLNKIRVVLRQAGRMLDSRSPDASGQVSFEHLAAGSYELEFTGALRHNCPILIQD